MTDSGTVDVHIDPYDYMNDIRVNLWLSCCIPFASRYFTKPEMYHEAKGIAHDNQRFTRMSFVYS